MKGKYGFILSTNLYNFITKKEKNKCTFTQTMLLLPL